MEGPVTPTEPRPVSKADQTAVLTKATLRAASQLGLTNKLLATVIGVSEATVSRMRNGDYTLQPGHKSFELAVLFVRLYRSLDAEPIALIQTVPGLMNVIQYLDARRAVV